MSLYTLVNVKGSFVDNVNPNWERPENSLVVVTPPLLCGEGGIARLAWGKSHPCLGHGGRMVIGEK